MGGHVLDDLPCVEALPFRLEDVSPMSVDGAIPPVEEEYVRRILVSIAEAARPSEPVRE